MLKIKFMLEYGCYPIWVYNEDKLINVGLPADLISNKELKNIVEDISNEYNKLFINNSIEFRYVGFPCKEDEEAFDKKIYYAIELLKKASNGLYDVEIDYEGL